VGESEIGMRILKKKGLIKGPYVSHRSEMYKSPAWRSIRSLVARQILDRLEIEHMRHAGKNNGALICTYDQFVAHGIRRMSIAPAIQLLKAAGVLLVTRQGRRVAGYHIPTMYALTYLPIGNAEPTDEWRNYLPNTPHRNIADFDGATAKNGKTPKNRAENQKSRYRKRYPPPVAETIPDAGSESATAAAGIKSATPFYNSSHVGASEEKLVEEEQKSESLEACTEPPAAPIDDDLPTCLRRGHPDCWLKD
jgi:hypothetical protein